MNSPLALHEATLSSIASRAALGALVLAGMLAGCAPAPVREPDALACPPAEKPVCPSPPAPVTPVPPSPPVEYRGKLVPASWLDLPAWGRESIGPALEAFARSCSV